MTAKVESWELRRVLSHLIGIQGYFEFWTFLGKGAFGSAYSIGEGIVLKITECPIEFQIAQQLKETPKSNLVKVLHTEVIDGFKVIVMEELHRSYELFFQYSSIEDWLKAGGFDLSCLPDFQVEGTWLGKDTKLANDIIAIITNSQELGIKSPDLRYSNVGLDQYGNLKMFDVTDMERIN